MVAKVGEYVAGPITIDALFATKVPTFDIKVRSLEGLPEGIKILSNVPGAEAVYQMFDYPGLPVRCKICCSKEHLQGTCPAKRSWKMRALGPGVPSGYAGPPVNTAVAVARMPLLWQQMASLARDLFSPSLRPSSETILKTGVVFRTSRGTTRV